MEAYSLSVITTPFYLFSCHVCLMIYLSPVRHNFIYIYIYIFILFEVHVFYTVCSLQVAFRFITLCPCRKTCILQYFITQEL